MAIPDVLYYRRDRVGFEWRDGSGKVIVPAITEMIVYAVRRSSTKLKLVPVLAGIPKEHHPDSQFHGALCGSTWSHGEYWTCMIPREKFRTYACIKQAAAFALYPELPRYLSGELTPLDANAPTGAQLVEVERKREDTAARARMRDSALVR